MKKIIMVALILSSALGQVGFAEEENGKEWCNWQSSEIESEMHLWNGFALYDLEGSGQQRFLAGSEYGNDIQRPSSSRNIDWKTREYVIGINTHLGPVEVDISHSDLNFGPGGDELAAGSCTEAGYFPGALRETGIFDPIRIPRMRGSSDNLKLHTDYKGKIVASATISNTDRKNEFSGTRVENDVIQGEFLWMPLPELRFSTQYRRRKSETSGPASETNIRSLVSSEVETVTGAVQYKPLRGMTVKSEYRHERKEKDNTEDWRLSDSVDRDIFSFSVDSKILKSLRVKSKYTCRDIREEGEDLALGIESTRSDEGFLSLSWTPATQVSACLRYTLSRDKKDDLQVLDSGELLVTSADDITESSKRFFGSVTFRPCESLCFTPSYTYSETETTELNLEFELMYEFRNKIGLGLTYKYTDYDDDSFDSSEDGTYHLARFMISKKW